MFNANPLNPSSSSQRPTPTNPFARALAETEQSLSSQPTHDQDNQNNLFGDALSKTGGSYDFSQMDQQAAQESQQRQLEEQRKKELMRRKLHDQINPVNQTELFSARNKKVKEEIDKLREELKLLVKDVAVFHKEVEITLMTEVVDPGQDGKYYITFFQKLRAIIMLLRQKIKSASTWATQMHSKSQKKKKRKGAAGMMVGGAAHEKTSTIQDMMHHERNSAYGGG